MGTAAEDAGSIYAEIRLELSQMERDGLDAQKAMDRLADKFKEKGKQGGEKYVEGFGYAQQKLNTRLNNMVTSLGAVSPKMGALGAKMAGVFSKPIFAMVPAVAMAFQAMLPVIGAIIAVIGVLIKAVTSAAKKQKEFSDNVKLSKEVSAKLKDQTVELNAAQQKSADITARQEHNAAVSRVAFQKLGDFFKSVFLPIINGVRSAFTAIGSAVSWVADKLGIVSQAEAEAAVEAQKLSGVNADLSQTIGDYQKQLKNLETAERAGVKSTEETARARLSAMEGYLDSLVKARTEAAGLAGEESRRVKELDNTIAAMIKERDRVAELIREYDELKRVRGQQSLQERIDAAKLELEKRYQAQRRLADSEHRAGLINELELQKKLEDAEASRYKALADIVALEALESGDTVDKAKAAAALVKETRDRYEALEINKSIEDQLAQTKIEQLRADAQIADSEEKRNRLLDEAIERENEILLAKRKLEKASLQAAIEKNDIFSDEDRDRILGDFDEITNGMLKVKATAKKESGNWLANALGMTDEKLNNMMSVGSAAINAYEDISGAALDITRRHAEEQMAIIENALKNILDNIQKAREAELIAAGFAVQNNAESLEAQLEAAKRCGDEVLIYIAKRRLEEQQINDRYDAEAKAAEEAAAKEKAEIEYRLAKQEHKSRTISAANAGVMAVLQALASAPPPYNLVLAGISGVAAAVQIGLLAANPPQMPTFEHGGIVPGNSYTGDKKIIGANSREGIFTLEDQKYLFDQIQNQKLGGGSVAATIVIVLDGREIAQNTVDLVNKGHYRIEARAVG